MATSDKVMGGKIEVARTKIKNGKFSLSGEFDEIERGTVEIIDADGRGKGLVNVVLEAAPIRVTYQGKYAKLRTDADGEYHKLLIASWQESKEYKEALSHFATTAAKREKLKPGRQKKAADKKYWELYYVMPKIRSKTIDAVIATSKDPLAKSLAIQLGGLGTSQEAVDKLTELEKILGPQQGLVNRREAIKASVLRRLNSKLMKSAGQHLNVSAKDIAGKSFILNEVLKKNKYVLLEFWASWCTPCLAEVPHMKKAHKEFNKKGFEIYSVSLDDDRERWVAASKKVMPPWISVSDLKAYKSSISQNYGVQIVPRNFLLDGKGQVIASDLRGEALSAKLAELFGK